MIVIKSFTFSYYYFYYYIIFFYIRIKVVHLYKSNITEGLYFWQVYAMLFSLKAFSCACCLPCSSIFIHLVCKGCMLWQPSMSKSCSVWWNNHLVVHSYALGGSKYCVLHHREHIKDWELTQRGIVGIKPKTRLCW